MSFMHTLHTIFCVFLLLFFICIIPSSAFPFCAYFNFSFLFANFSTFMRLKVFSSHFVMVVFCYFPFACEYVYMCVICVCVTATEYLAYCLLILPNFRFQAAVKYATKYYTLVLSTLYLIKWLNN